MTQEDLKDYLELPEQKCYVYKTKEGENGITFFMRKTGTKKLAVLFPPKSDIYKRENVCHICNQLDVTVPNWAQPAQDILNAVKIDIQKRGAQPEEKGFSTN